MPLNVLILLACGTWWGFSLALSRIVMEGGPNPLVIAFWQSAGSAVLVWSVLAVLGRLPRIDGVYLRYTLAIGVLGGALPATLLYWALAHIGAGVLSVCMATIPLMQFGVSAVFGLERAKPLRLAGLALGMIAVWIIAQPDGGAAPVVWVIVAMSAAFSYVLEEAFIAARRPEHIGPAATMAGMVAASSLILLPVLAFTSEPFPFSLAAPGTREAAMAAFILGSPIIYGGFVLLITRAGPVFSAQVSYVITLAGVAGGVWLLGEEYGGEFWGALALMIVALALGLPGGRAVRPNTDANT